MINCMQAGRGSLILCLLLHLELVARETPQLKPIAEIKTGKISLGKQAETYAAKDFIYWYTTDEWNEAKHTLMIFRTNYQTQMTDSFSLKIPDSIKIASLPQIAVTGKFMVLTDDYYFHQYLFSKNKNTFEFTSRILTPPDSPVNTVTALDDESFLFECLYNFHPANRQHNANLAVYNAVEKKTGNFIHPDMPCIAFSHLEKQWTAVSRSRIALASPCGYKVRLYDHSLNLLDSICLKPENWKDPSKLVLPFSTDPSVIHPKLLIEKLQRYQDSVSRIEKIFFLDDTTFLVSAINAHAENERRIDVWKIGKTNRLVSSSIQKIHPEESDTITNNRTIASLNELLTVRFVDGRFITFNDEDFFYKNGIQAGDFQKLKNEYYENNDPQFSIGIYRIDLP